MPIDTAPPPPNIDDLVIYSAVEIGPDVSVCGELEAIWDTDDGTLMATVRVGSMSHTGPILPR